jgi:preprotein translocase subunit YajC
VYIAPTGVLSRGRRHKEKLPRGEFRSSGERRDAQQLQASLGAGDHIVTIGGLHATVISVDDDIVTVEIAPGVDVKFARPAIARVVQQQEEAPAALDEPDVPDDETPSATEPPVIESPVVETRKNKD